MPRDPKTNQPEVVVDRLEHHPDAILVWAHADEPGDEETEGSGFLRPVDGAATIEVERFRRVGESGYELAIFSSRILPKVGTSYWLQGRWVSDVLPALRDSNWRRGVVPKHFEDFCLVTYKSLAEGDDAYSNDAGMWISVAAWEEYVRDDRIRLRSFHWPASRDIRRP